MLYYKKVGTGTPLIILHGLFGSGDNWATLAKQYAEAGFECYLVDQRNHGRSFHSYDFNYTVMANDLAELMEIENISSACIIGHSMGGKTAMFFAANFAVKVQKLIVADIAPRYYPPHHQTILAALNAIDLSRPITRKEVEEQLRVSIKDEGTIQFLLKNLYWKNETELAWRFGLKEIEQNIDSVGEAFTAENISIPTLFLKGAKSGYIKSEDELEIRSIFNQVTIETIPDAGHWLHAENPKAFLTETKRFLL